MVRKILIVVAGLFLVLFVVIGVTTCGIAKIAEDFVKEREPDMKAYVQMNLQEQNEYVEKHLDEMLRSIGSYADATEKENWNVVIQDPQVREAGLKLGRAICAGVIMELKSITDTLTAEQKEAYQKEVDTLEDASEDFVKALEKFEKEPEK